MAPDNVTPGCERAHEEPARLTRRSVIRAAAIASVGARTLLAAPQPTTREADSPCLAVWHDGGYREKPNSGLEFAVWPDGAILLSPRPEQLGKYLLTGSVENADLEEMLKAIRLAGFFEAGRDYVVPDSSYTTITVRDGEHAEARSFHEYLMPGFGGDINTDPEYRRFVRTWRRVSGAIEALAPTRIERLGERKEFRGYIVDKWYDTPWRDKRKWKAQPAK